MNTKPHAIVASATMLLFSLAPATFGDNVISSVSTEFRPSCRAI